MACLRMRWGGRCRHTRRSWRGTCARSADDYQAEAIPHAHGVGRLRCANATDTIARLGHRQYIEDGGDQAGDGRAIDPAWFPVGAFGNESAERADLTKTGAWGGRGTTPDAGDQRRAMSSSSGIRRTTFMRRAPLAPLAVAVCTGYVTRDQLIGSHPDFLLADLSAFLDLVPL